MIQVSYSLLDYSTALILQEKIHHLRKQSKIDDCLLLLEHPPTITIGKNGNVNNVLFSNEMRKKLDVKVFQIGRGGDVTYHGPGQLVGYPIWDIRKYSLGVKDFIYQIEEIFIEFLRNDYQIKATHDEHYTGVWVNNTKITAIGFQISRFISMHGFAFNMNTNLDHFKWINPCGIQDKGVTSLEQLTGKKQSRLKVEKSIVQTIETLFHSTCQKLSPKEFEQYLSKKEIS